MKTKIEIIQETIQFYSSDLKQRAVKYDMEKDKPIQTSCYYLTDDGRKCAIGRCMNPEILENNKDDINTSGSAIELYSELQKRINISFEDILLPAYKGHEIEFWIDVQYIHDTSSFWDDNGLTERGYQESQRLKNKWIHR